MILDSKVCEDCDKKSEELYWVKEALGCNGGITRRLCARCKGSRKGELVGLRKKPLTPPPPMIIKTDPYSQEGKMRGNANVDNLKASVEGTLKVSDVKPEGIKNPNDREFKLLRHKMFADIYSSIVVKVDEFTVEEAFDYTKKAVDKFDNEVNNHMEN